MKNERSNSSEGFITLTVEEAAVLNKASDLWAVIHKRRDVLVAAGFQRVFLRTETGGAHEQLFGPISDFTMPAVRA